MNFNKKQLFINRKKIYWLRSNKPYQYLFMTKEHFMQSKTKKGLNEASQTAIAIMAVDGLTIDDDTLELLRKIDSGEITHEEALKIIANSIKNDSKNI